MSTLESIVLPFVESRKLVEAGVKLDTALAWFPQYADDYDREAPASLWPDEWKRIAEGQPVVCVREEMEDHTPICPAPVLSEILDAIRGKVGNPLEERTIILSQDGHLEVSSCAGVRSPHGEYQIAYNDTDLLAAYSLLLEVAK